MKENKGKGTASDEVIQIEKYVLTQSRPVASEKRKTISKMFDTGSLLSCRGNKKPKHGLFTLSKLTVVQTNLSIPPTTSNQPLRAKTPLPDVSLSLKPFAAAPPKSCLLTLLRSEGLAQDRFQQAVTNKDVTICYDMFMKEFEQSTVHDLFNVFSFGDSHL